MNRALKLTDAEIVAQTTDNCGCLKLPGQVGNHGWHWWIVTRNYLETVQKMQWRIEYPVRPYTEFQYDPRHEASYLGLLHAAERCPAYVAATERKASEDGTERRGKYNRRAEGGRR